MQNRSEKDHNHTSSILMFVPAGHFNLLGLNNATCQSVEWMQYMAEAVFVNSDSSIASPGTLAKNPSGPLLRSWFLHDSCVITRRKQQCSSKCGKQLLPRGHFILYSLVHLRLLVINFCCHRVCKTFFSKKHKDISRGLQ